MKRIRIIVLMLLGLVAALLAMIGVFWTLELAPLLIFVGVGIAYGLLSRQHRPVLAVQRVDSAHLPESTPSIKAPANPPE